MSFIVGAVIGTVGALGGAAIASSGARDAARTAAAGSERELEFARESRDLARADQAPYREAGYTALDALMSLTGLSGPQGGGGSGSGGSGGPPAQGGPQAAPDYLRGLRGRRLGSRNEGGPIGYAVGGGFPDVMRNPQESPPQPRDYLVNETGPESVYEGGGYTRSANPRTISTNGTGYVHPNENPGGVEGGYNFQTDPGYEFRVAEGQRAIERGAAAAGGLLSGGFGRRITRYGQDYASNEYNNVYNRISNIAGLGQVSAGQSGNAALQGGFQMGRAASEGALSSAYGQQGATNAWAGAINEIGQLPWDRLFEGGGGGGSGRSDLRLKENIQKIGEANGINIYSWSWNDIAKEMGVDDPTTGVIAQEVILTHPEAVSMDDGYYRVDYRKLS